MSEGPDNDLLHELRINHAQRDDDESRAHWLWIVGIIGAVIVWLVFNGHTASTLGGNFSQVVFQFRVTPELLWNGIKWALAIGFISGLFPAVRAVRLP